MLYFPPAVFLPARRRAAVFLPARRRAALRRCLPSSLLRRSSVQAAPRPFGLRGPGRVARQSRVISRRWWVRGLLVGAAIVIGMLASGGPAFAATGVAPSATTAARAATGTQAGTATQAAAGALPATSGRLAAPVVRATLDDKVLRAEPGGVCQVPGIGDIGGLVGLCAAGSSGLIGDLNNICEPSLPQPEQATGGLDSMIAPPESAQGGKTLYDNYGVAGQFWAAHDMQCSDMTSLIGNNVAGMVFDVSKAMDRVTITVYQAAAGDSILTWLRNAVDGLISALGKAIYIPYLGPVVILGAMWLAWQGLVRKRATRAIEGTLWMVIAATAATCLIARPAAFTGVGTAVSNGVTSVLNSAFAHLPGTGNGNCLPVQAGDQQSVTADYSFTSGNGMVDQNANELWSVLVCKPWLYGELGSTAFATTGTGTQTVVNQYGRQLLWSQAIAANENPTAALISAKQSTYTGIAAQLKANDPAIYPLFQGDQWTTRLEIAFGALFAALVAGLLILLVALTLIVLKLGFLLLLVAGPFFLIIGTHPGFGRIIAIRWFEMLVGVLMKQVAIAITLSVLLYCYSLIMGTADSVLPWALKILMIALVTVTVFIYRRPFQHLFSAVGYGTIGSEERAQYSLREAGSTFRNAVPGTRVARWARRNPGQVVGLAAGVAAGGVAGAAAGARAMAGGGADADADAAGGGQSANGQAGTGTSGAVAASGDAYTARLRADASLSPDADPTASGNGRRLASPLGGAGARAKALARADSATGRPAPPLDLPSRSGGAVRNGSSSNGGAGSGSAAPVGSAPGGRADSGVAAGTSGGPSSGSVSRSGTRGWFDGAAGSRAGSAASGWSRGAGRSAGSRGRPSSGDSQGSAPPLGGGGSTGGAGPAWPGSGWSGHRSGARQRPAPPAEGGSESEGAKGADGEAPMPFWLRSKKRDK
jgi:TrbL/VirB6 plasmid conjugal transfer protein